MERGAQVRATGSTRMNEVSSRSHAVFIIIVEQSEFLADSDDDDAASQATVGRGARGERGGGMRRTVRASLGRKEEAWLM